MQEIILHIGRHKSGTKSVQKFLSDNTAALASTGVVYPQAARLAPDGKRPDMGHHRLATAMTEGRAGAAEARDLASAILREAGDAPRIVISSEGFQNVQDPAVLRDMFPGRTFTVICYVREYLDYVQTAYQQEIKAGGFAGSFHEFVLNRFRLNTETFFNKWSEISDRFIFSLYAHSTLLDNNVVIDFAKRLDLDIAQTGQSAEERRFNPSISGNLLGWKAVLNQVGSDTSRQTWQRMMHLANKVPRFRGRFYIPADIARQIRVRGQAHNDFLRARFGDVPMIDFSDYPVVYDPKTWSHDLACFRDEMPMHAEPGNLAALSPGVMFRSDGLFPRPVSARGQDDGRDGPAGGGAVIEAGPSNSAQVKVASDVPKSLAVDAQGRFSIADQHFVIDNSPRNDRRRTNADAYTIVKSRPYINLYYNLALKEQPEGIIELGVFEGGGYVFLDCLFKPNRMSAVDISATPIPALQDYCARHPGRTVHYGVSQTNAALLRRIVSDDLDGILDLVVDDASHSYAETRASFDILFPLLRPGGLYIIEDWGWSHHPSYQGADAPRAGDTALTTLLFEQIVLMGSTNEIAEIRVLKPLYILRKARHAGSGPRDMWRDVLTRGRALPRI
jgi:hypothetical protein